MQGAWGGSVGKKGGPQLDRITGTTNAQLWGSNTAKGGRRGDQVGKRKGGANVFATAP